jgi:hypothetical protein
MKKSVEALLEGDHSALGRLLTELDAELRRPDITRACEMLDLFWARLAIHIRAENLHLFPALADAPPSLLPERRSAITFDFAHGLFLRLRSDHDFFMKELAQTVKIMRGVVAQQQAGLKEVEKVGHRMTTIKKRLETHNQLEEKHVYSWPALLFDEQTVTRLCDRLRHELENLPPRFA